MKSIETRITSLAEGGCDDNDANSTIQSEDADCDGVVTAEDCDDNEPQSTTVANDADCDGVLTDDDCDDNDATSLTRLVDPECDGFYLADNGVTVLCPDAAVDTSGTVDGVTYTRRNRSFLLNEASSGDFSTSCTSGITDMNDLFSGNLIRNRSFNENIGSWDVSSVTNMNYMFLEATAFNQDLSGWCVSYFTTKPSYFDDSATS